MNNNNSIDKLAEVYASDDEDSKAFQKAQANLIVTQTKQINELKTKLDEMSKQISQLTIENTRLKTVGAESDVEKGSDAETICLVQLALLNSFSMQRELTLEETRKTEIYTKTLVLLNSKKKEEKNDPVGELNNDQLMAALKELA